MASTLSVLAITEVAGRDFSLKLHRGAARGHAKRADRRDRRRELVRHSLGEVSLRGVGGTERERQHGDGANGSGMRDADTLCAPDGIRSDGSRDDGDERDECASEWHARSARTAAFVSPDSRVSVGQRVTELARGREAMLGIFLERVLYGVAHRHGDFCASGVRRHRRLGHQLREHRLRRSRTHRRLADEHLVGDRAE
jgi:hypothetical protein